MDGMKGRKPFVLMCSFVLSPSPSLLYPPD